MAKGGKSSTGAGIPQKHLHSRISYLYQAAVYLDTAERKTKGKIAKPLQGESEREQAALRPQSTPADKSKTEMPDNQPRLQIESSPLRYFSAQTHHLLTSMRSVSQKSQIRLSRSIKRSVCRRCNALLTLNSTAQVENLNWGGRKPWADVLVVRCCQCGDLKRYPVGMGEEGQRRAKKGRRGATTGFHEGGRHVENKP